MIPICMEADNLAASGTRSYKHHPAANANQRPNKGGPEIIRFQARSVIRCGLSKPPPSASGPHHRRRDGRDCRGTGEDDERSEDHGKPPVETNEGRSRFCPLIPSP